MLTFNTKYTSLLVCILFCLISTFTVFGIGKWKSNSVLWWDISGYYCYLPATIIYKDVKELKFYAYVDSIYQPTGKTKWYGLHRIEKKNTLVNKYTSGVAIFQLPAFLVAHIIAILDSSNKPDGYSPPYQLSVQLTTVLFSFLGLLILRQFLKEFGFREIIISLVLVLICFGTNFFYYAAFDQGLGHNYSFFLCSIVLLYTQRIIDKPKMKYIALIGFTLGWASLVRPIDGLFILIPFLWIIIRYNFFQFASAHKISILLGIIFFILPWIPQLIYWRITTGHFWFYSYTNEGFNFLSPEIIKGLFSYRKGWFVYTPLVLLAILGLFYGFQNSSKNIRRYCYIILLFLCLYIYVVFSWWMWFYGGSFGSRVLINILPLLSVGFALVISRILRSKSTIKTFLFVILSFFIFLNIYQSWQYSQGIIHCDKMNKEYYWRVFLKDETTEKDLQLLYEYPPSIYEQR